MTHFSCIGLPLLWQTALMTLAALYITGNGTYLGLGALLLGFVAIPLTALINLAHLHSHWTLPRRRLALQCNAIAAIVSAALVLLAPLDGILT